MTKVKERAARSARRSGGRGPRVTRISAKNQATLPVEALHRAGLRAGDRVRVIAEGPGRIVLEHATRPVDRWAGCLTGVYPKGYLKELRREWR